jgi:hypothetical protein
VVGSGRVHAAEQQHAPRQRDREQNGQVEARFAENIPFVNDLSPLWSDGPELPELAAAERALSWAERDIGATRLQKG